MAGIIQNVYGKKSDSIKQLNEPIIALGAGYQTFYAKRGSRALSGRSTGGGVENAFGQLGHLDVSKRGVPVYRKSDNTYAYGRYMGNYILYRYYREEDLEESDYVPESSISGSPIIDRALKGIVDEVSTKTFTYQGGVDIKSPEEQTSAIGGKPQKGKHSVDVDTGVGLHQVSYSGYRAKFAHHGLEQSRRVLKDSITKALKNKEGLSDDEMYKKAAKAGLTYFKGQIKNTNKIMIMMQKKNPTASSPSVSRGKDGAHFKNMMKKATKRTMGNAMVNFTRTALLNIGDYLSGVYYNMPVTKPPYTNDNPVVYGRIGQFQLEENPIVKFNESALKEAHVVYGMDSTTYDFLKQGYGIDAYDINSTRTHAQVFASVKAVGDEFVVGNMAAGNIGGLHANTGNYTATINVKAAGKELSQAISNELLPFIRKASAGATRKFSANSILGSRETITNEGRTFWAQPYLSIFDGKTMRFGSK